jgi:hypothetical protein
VLGRRIDQAAGTDLVTGDGRDVDEVFCAFMYGSAAAIRTTIISPGAVATELPNSITAASTSQAIHDLYKKYPIPADSFARCVLFAIAASRRTWT